MFIILAFRRQRQGDGHKCEASLGDTVKSKSFRTIKTETVLKQKKNKIK